FGSTKHALTIIASVGSYLMVAFIFSKRHDIARLYFPGRGESRAAYQAEVTMATIFSSLPGVLALLSVLLFLGYLYTVNVAVRLIAYESAMEVPSGNEDAAPVGTRIEADTTIKTVAGLLPAFAGQKTVRIIHEERKGKKDGELSIRDRIEFPDEATVEA